MKEGDVLAHGGIICLAGYSDILPTFVDINESLFHWQSQSTTSDTSATGQRYINHRKTGDRELIFVREYKNNKLGAAPYTFLGIADYVRHEGSKPMNIVWKLREPIPAKYIKRTNKLVV